MKFFISYNYKAFPINLRFLSIVGVCPTTSFDLKEAFFTEKRFKISNRQGTQKVHFKETIKRQYKKQIWTEKKWFKKIDSKKSQDNGIAMVNLENSTTTESVELDNISNIRNNLEKNNVNKDNT